MTSKHVFASGDKTNVAASRSPFRSFHNTDAAEFIPARLVTDRYQISQMTLWRWLRDEEMAFPAPVYLGRYRYWRIADIEAWEAHQMARGAA